MEEIDLEIRVRNLETSQAVLGAETKAGINTICDKIENLTRSVEQYNASREQQWSILNSHTYQIGELEKKKVVWNVVMANVGIAIAAIGSVFYTLLKITNAKG